MRLGINFVTVDKLLDRQKFNEFCLDFILTIARFDGNIGISYGIKRKGFFQNKVLIHLK